MFKIMNKSNFKDTCTIIDLLNYLKQKSADKKFAT